MHNVRSLIFAPFEDQQDLWKWKYLLDIDGLGLSGRFYSLMKSKSLVFKCAMFREWHNEWLWPWVHYVPLGLNGSDWFETVRFFAQEETRSIFWEKGWPMNLVNGLTVC